MNQQKTIENRQAELAFTKERLDSKEKELELGLITEDDLTEFKKNIHEYSGKSSNRRK